MTTPLVCGILLTADRPAMTARAIASFEAQTYKNKALLILDSGVEKLGLRSNIRQIYCTVEPGAPHGELCNIANGLAETAEILAHFDSDDWSHPERLSEQVDALQSTRSLYQSQRITDDFACVGYNEMLFWDSMAREAWWYTHHGARYTVGASQCYWREAWVRAPFKPMVRGADKEWGYRVKMYGSPVRWARKAQREEPRMICGIHGGNISSRILRGHEQWRRAPEWDAYCIERMVL